MCACYCTQEPISIELDKKMVRGTGGKLTQKAITYQYVPLEESLKAFLSNQEIQYEVSYLLYSYMYRESVNIA